MSESFELADSTENPLAAEIRQAMGAGPFEKVMACFPQFERVDGKIVDQFPTDAMFLDALKNAPEWILKDLGLQRWSKENNLWLFPGEWYEHIPDGYEIVDINDQKSKFHKSSESDDIRGGALAYGIFAGKNTPPTSQDSSGA